MPENTINNVQVVPVRDFTDVARIQGEIDELLNKDDSSEEDSDLVRALESALGDYMSFCPAGATRPYPGRFLSYLLSCVKRVSPEEVAAETGIRGFQELLRSHRNPTPEESVALAKFFGTNDEAFMVADNAPND